MLSEHGHERNIRCIVLREMKEIKARENIGEDVRLFTHRTKLCSMILTIDAPILCECTYPARPNPFCHQVTYKKQCELC